MIKYSPMLQFNPRLLGVFISSKCVRLFSFKTPTCYSSMKILNVAEKNDAAKSISYFLSQGKCFRREGLSVYNKIYEFEYNVFGQKCLMIMTSVSGHLLEFSFQPNLSNWKTVNPISLFDAPIQPVCLSPSQKVKKSLEKEVKQCNKVIIWTDCDREGENIGFQIIQVCKNVKPNITFYRAKFSEITHESVKRALYNLEMPNKAMSDAVNVRKELDLRIGAAFTRFQTILLKEAFPNTLNKENIVSYGSCQFPTLGFVVDRFKEISNFIPESFWQINVKHTVGNVTSDFLWQRNRLFDKLACEVLYDKCKEKNLAVVENVNSKPTIKRRPKPLDTIALEKLASSKLKINAKEALSIAEKLYCQGLISYPRTETNIFAKEINLEKLVAKQTEDPSWGDFARRVLQDSPNPFQGNKTDNAHPPIHPTQYPTQNLNGNELKVYQLIVRHFLACLSKHAEGLETTVDIDIAEEKFVAKGLMITARNYLEVYPYDKWSDKEINIYRKGDTFVPEIEMMEGKTTAPKLLTEADLIALMEKHGIGTDATHAEHIEKIKSRLYVGLQNNKYFTPRTLGMGLVEGYINMGHEAMTKPDLRAELESDLKRICENQKAPQEVLKKHIEIYKKVFIEITEKVNRLVESVNNYLQVGVSGPIPKNLFENSDLPVGKCPSCGSKMVLLKTEDKKFVKCGGYPQCREVSWFPSFVLEAEVTKDTCPTCGPNHNLIRFKFDRKICFLPSVYVGCIGGCDVNLRKVLGLNNKKRKRSPTRTYTSKEASNDDTNDSGVGSMNESPSTRIIKPKLNCNCGSPAVSLTTKKPGPNYGRKFYSCDSSINSQKCTFFLWEDEVIEQQRTAENEIGIGFSRNTISGEEDIRCYCAIVCTLKTVRKPGKNLGRQYFSCGKSMQDSDRCNFFKWIENKENTVQNFSNQPDDDTYSRGSNDAYFVQNNLKNQRRRKKNGAFGEGNNRKNWPRK